VEVYVGHFQHNGKRTIVAEGWVRGKGGLETRLQIANREERTERGCSRWAAMKRR